MRIVAASTPLIVATVSLVHSLPNLLPVLLLPAVVRICSFFTSHDLLLLLQTPKHPLPHIRINHSTDPKRRHNPTNPKRKTRRPILQHLRRAARYTDRPLTFLMWSVIQVQSQQMQRRTNHLHRRRRQKLRRTNPAKTPLHALTHRQPWRHHRREVETRKDRQHVPGCK